MSKGKIKSERSGVNARHPYSIGLRRKALLFAVMERGFQRIWRLDPHSGGESDLNSWFESFPRSTDDAIAEDWDRVGRDLGKGIPDAAERVEDSTKVLDDFAHWLEVTKSWLDAKREQELESAEEDFNTIASFCARGEPGRCAGIPAY